MTDFIDLVLLAPDESRPARDLSLVALDVLTLDAAEREEWRHLRGERDVRRIPR